MQKILLDPGSPNTIVTLSLVWKLGLKPLTKKTSTIYLSGSAVTVFPVVLPDLKLGAMKLENVRVYAGLDKQWADTIILGLNVLNHLVYTVDRTKGSGFINIRLGNEAKTNFNRLISSDGKYYITDLPECEMKV